MLTVDPQSWMKRADVIAAFNHLAPNYDAWYETPLGAFADAREKEAVFVC